MVRSPYWWQDPYGWNVDLPEINAYNYDGLTVVAEAEGGGYDVYVVTQDDILGSAFYGSQQILVQHQQNFDFIEGWDHCGKDGAYWQSPYIDLDSSISFAVSQQWGSYNQWWNHAWDIAHPYDLWIRHSHAGESEYPAGDSFLLFFKNDYSPYAGSKAFNEIKLAFANQNFAIDEKIKMLLSFYTLSENDTVLKKKGYELLKILTEANPDDAKTYSVYADFLYRDKKLKEAKEQYLKVIALDSSKYIVWEQLLNIDGELENYESLEKISTTTIELFPNQPLPYLYKGISKTTLKKYDEAIDALKKGKEYAINNKLLLAEFYSRLGSVYNDTKDFTASEIAFDKCIELDSKNASALNNFCYYLSLRNDKLDKAAELAKKANNLSPNTPAYEDTYGWVLYKQKDYAEAKKWLEKAIEKSNNDPVIFEHYGDILYKLGETEKAYKYWLKAKEKGQGSEFLERKIKEKKLIEE